MSTYIFDSNPQEQEFRRLQLVEAANDPTTIALLEETGIQPGWHCLEFGPGAGSILRWLGHRVGPTGLVVGVDKNTAHLLHFDNPPYLIYQGTFPDLRLSHTFDLIHCRYVLIHNKEDMVILQALLKLLKPGGIAIFEEPDFTTATLLDPKAQTPEGRVNQAICSMFHQAGLQPNYALLLPLKIKSAGFDLDRLQSLLHLCPGRSTIAKVMGESAMALQDAYCKTGLCSPKDIQQYVRVSEDPYDWRLYHCTTSVLVRKPVT
ncbi:MAG: class I SAM-dependent methyltransferase [Nitrospira sp.]|nr:class I SAM-dependent methyltransferase [Nitrospira sp.]MCB9711869.1 class I SAM-dependent methyltransferase [Nitrospiraceae bacterium]MDR4487533.1 class I SAM-dependent methyltransferase [Nitrospirales bacterium]